jgi:hypothetical protein
MSARPSETELNAWIEKQWPRGDNVSRPPWDRSVFREHFEAERAYKASQAVERSKLDEALKRIATLERKHAVMRKNYAVMVDALAEAIPTIAGEVCELVLAKKGVMQDAGIWREGETYAKGALATHGGSAWVATIENTGMKPGDGAAWRLAAKSDLSELKRQVREEVERQLSSKPTVK